MSRLTVVVLTYNEEQNLPDCLDSLRAVPHDLVIVDSGSTDATLCIAAEHNARVLQHTFESHARQWQWTLDQLEPDTDWVLGLDADQRLSPELSAELCRLLEQPSIEYDGFYVKRRQIFRGRWIKHGGYYPKYMLKLFRPRTVRIDELDLMDHHFYVPGGVSTLHYDLIEDNHKEAQIAFWVSKHVRYAELHAQEEVARRATHHAWPVEARLFGTPDERVVWLKQRWYNLPLYLRPFVFFAYRYLFRLGFLDGKQGFIFHFLQTFWYRLLIDIRVDELQQRS